MSELTKKTLAKIKKEGIKLIPKWQFLAKEWFMWLAFFVAVLVGGVAASIIMYRVLNNEWEIAPYLAESVAGFVLITLPYFWIALFIAFIFLADYQLKQTKEGYKYRFIWILVLNIVLSLGLGIILYQTEFSEKLENAFENYVPYYDKFASPRHRLWMNPDRGLLIGRILEMGSGSALLEDLDGRNWDLELGPEFPWDREVGDVVRLMGERRAENLFKMDAMKPWQGQDLFRSPMPKLLQKMKPENSLRIELLGDGEGDFQASVKVLDQGNQSLQEFFESPEIVGQKHLLQIVAGDDDTVDQVIVTWGSGAEETFQNVKVGEVLRVGEK